MKLGRPGGPFSICTTIAPGRKPRALRRDGTHEDRPSLRDVIGEGPDHRITVLVAVRRELRRIDPFGEEGAGVGEARRQFAAARLRVATLMGDCHVPDAPRLGDAAYGPVVFAIPISSMQLAIFAPASLSKPRPCRSRLRPCRHKTEIISTCFHICCIYRKLINYVRNYQGCRCVNVTVEDSAREAVGLEGRHDQARARPLSREEPGRPTLLASEARVNLDLSGQGDGWHAPHERRSRRPRSFRMWRSSSACRSGW